MVTFRNNNNSNRRGNFRRNTRNFKTSNDTSKFSSNLNNDNFKRNAPERNNHNAPKLIEKYNDLREALSNVTRFYQRIICSTQIILREF